MDSTARRLTPAARIPRATIAALLVLTAACAKHDASPPASAGDSAAAPAAAAPDTGATSRSASGITPVRGTLASVSDSALTITTAAGDVRVTIEPPLHVYARVPAKLSDVTSNSFVGVTSVMATDGKPHATEIHIFPESLRGTGEGSYLMKATGAGGTSGSTMTNGTVKDAPGDGGPPRMTNGTVASQSAGTLTVQYKGGSQSIIVTEDAAVTALAASSTKLARGAKVVVLANKQPDGVMKASNVVLAQ